MSWRCNNDICSYEQPRYFGLCPKCRDGTGVEVSEDEPNSQTNNAFHQVGFEYNGPPIVNEIRSINPDEAEEEAVVATRYPGLNAIISSAKGFVEAQVCLMGASPGVGKSTLCMSIADEGTLYISTEENFKQVNQRALRIKANRRVRIMNSTSIQAILEAIRTFDGRLVIVDSLNGIEFGVGYAIVAKFANQITKVVKETNKVAVITSQVTRAGEITGMNSIIHIVDTVMHLERSEVSSNIIATSSKNRYGEIGSVAVFQHRADGFVEVDVDHMNPESEVGATYTETRFGHKVMTIAIEALVADSQSSFGMRKSNGYNQNRLIQLVGILSYYSRLNLNAKDIYVAVSNGLYTDDISVELAMANSILSSYYGKSEVVKAKGEIRLNGKINNGTLDGREVTHISQLVNLYKKEGGKHV
jgi:DNA repair protein RadA/Sms